MNPETLKVKVVKTEKLINGLAKSVYFEPLPDEKSSIGWDAGQHITLLLNIDGNEVRRSYSISSSPTSGDLLRITVKRVKDGLVSNYVNDIIKVGDVIDILAPFGGFKLLPGKQLRRTHYLFGAGSGITPLYSMIHTAMCSEPYSVAHLIYGNKNDKTIIFKECFAQLMSKYPGRLTVSHVLSEPSLFSGFKYWKKGVVNQAAINIFIDEFKPYAQDAQYYVCGPGGMNDDVKRSLMKRDVPSNRIHMESYGGSKNKDDSVEGVKAAAVITLGGTSHQIIVEKNHTILDAAKKSALSPPYSCESGVCGACKAYLKNGKIHMRASMALEDKEIEDGYILTCQSIPQSKELELSYE